MKQIKVNNNCNGCGLCIVNCPYLQENADGNAEFIAGKSIAANDLDAVAKVISECPQNALELVDTGSTNKKGKDGVKDIISMLQKELENFHVPKVSKSAISFKAKDYPIPVPFTTKEHRRDYSSEGAARSTARDEFDRLCYSESAYRPTLKKIFVEYKVRFLKPYYTITDTEDSAYFQYNQQIRNLLANAYTEITELIGDKVPESWKEFSVYLGRSDSPIEILMRFDDKSTCSGIIAELKSLGKYSKLDWYIDEMDFDYDEEYDGEGLFGKTKYKKKYYFSGFNSAARDFIKDLTDAISYRSSDITDVAVTDVNYALESFEKKVKEEWQKKISELDKYLK